MPSIITFWNKAINKIGQSVKAVGSITHISSIESSIPNTIGAHPSEAYAKASMAIKAKTRSGIEEIKRITTPKFGEIRIASELSIKDIVMLVNHQQQSITAEEINRLLVGISGKDRQVALEVLNKMTQFGNMKSLNKLAAHINNNGGQLLGESCHNKIGLASALEYIQGKQVNLRNFDLEDFSELESNWANIAFSENGTNFLLDEVALEALTKNKDLVTKIKSNCDVKILYPEGWINGVNVFNQNCNIVERLNTILTKVKELQTTKKMDLHSAINEALNLPIKEKLQRLGLLDRLTIVNNSSLKTSTKTTIEKIVSNLAPDKPTEAEVTKLFAGRAPEHLQPALEIFANDMQIYSPRRMSTELVDMHKKLVAINGNSDNGLYYFMPLKKGSFNVVSYQYKLANNIPIEKFIHDTSKIPTDAKTIAFLDDMAGTGDMMETHSYDLARNIKPEQTKIVLSPLFGKPKAEKRFEGKPLFMFAPHTLYKNFLEGEYFKSLSPEQQDLILKVANAKHNEVVNTAFPYMSPDNNTYLFAETVADKFLLNGKGNKAHW